MKFIVLNILLHWCMYMCIPIHSFLIYNSNVESESLQLLYLTLLWMNTLLHILSSWIRFSFSLKLLFLDWCTRWYSVRLFDGAVLILTVREREKGAIVNTQTIFHKLNTRFVSSWQYFRYHFGTPFFGWAHYSVQNWILFVSER